MIRGERGVVEGGLLLGGGVWATWTLVIWRRLSGGGGGGGGEERGCGQGEGGDGPRGGALRHWRGSFKSLESVKVVELRGFDRDRVIKINGNCWAVSGGDDAGGAEQGNDNYVTKVNSTTYTNQSLH